MRKSQTQKWLPDIRESWNSFEQPHDYDCSKSDGERPPGHVRRDVCEDAADEDSDNSSDAEMEHLVETAFIVAESHKWCILVNMIEPITMIKPMKARGTIQSEGVRNFVSLLTPRLRASGRLGGKIYSLLLVDR